MKYLKLFEDFVESDIDKILFQLTDDNWRSLGNFGLHGGTLGGKSDDLRSGYSGDLPFTGYYFYSDFKRAYTQGDRSKGNNSLVQIINIGDYPNFNYNLYRPFNANDYWELKSALKQFYRSFRRNDDVLKNCFDVLCKNVNFTLRNKFQSKEKEILNISIKWQDELDNLIENSQNWEIERLETRIMKIIGYEGIDNRRCRDSEGTKNPDCSTEGSVIFDLKPNTVYTKEQFYNNNRGMVNLYLNE